MKTRRKHGIVSESQHTRAMSLSFSLSMTAPSYPTHQSNIDRWTSLTTSGSVTLVLGAACVLVLLLQGVIRQQNLSIDRAVLAAMVVVMLLALDYALKHRYQEAPPFRVSIAALLGHAFLVEAMTLLDGLTYTSIIYLTLPFPTVFLLGKRAGLFVGVGLFVWFTFKFMLLKPTWASDPALLNTYLIFLVALILITAMAQVVQQERTNRQRAEGLLRDLKQSHKHLAESNIQLADYAQQVATLATVEERNRLARDIHDSLGHYLTVIGVQLEKALIVHDDSPNDTLSAVRHAKRLTDQALTDVRQSVSTLRRDQVPFRLYSALETLVANVRDLSFTVDLFIEGDEHLFSKQQLLALYRAAQEGLTNVQKHAHAQHVTIMIELNERQATLTLEDDGVGFSASSHAREGYGLRGVRERLELVGGQLMICANSQGGTQLYASIPRISSEARGVQHGR